MRRAWWAAGLVVGLLGCAETSQDRFREYNDDGVALYGRGEYSAARQSFEAALALRPGEPGVLYNLGQCCEHANDHDGALRYYQGCLERAPGHAPCRYALCTLLVKEGRTPEAARMVGDWMAAEPKLAAAFAADGYLAHQAGDLPRAQDQLQHALELDPRNPQALVELGLVYEAQQRPDRAAAVYERALEQDPHQPEVLKRLNHLRSQGTGPPRPD
jgi:Tfp pilus assembly protein PilF